MLGQGWACVCGEQCGEGEVWIAYITVAGLVTVLPTIYVVVSLILGRTPLMMVLRVPGLWKALRKLGLADQSANRGIPPG